MDWYENEYIPRVGKRGAEIIEARGASSAASAANAAIDHVHDWVQGADGLRSMAVPLGRRVRRRGGAHVLASRCAARAARYEIVEGLEVGDFAQGRIDATVDELKEERDAVQGSAWWLSRVARPGRGSGRRATPPRADASRGPPCATSPSFCEAGQHAVEVVLLDAHLLGDLGDRDAGAGAHELERLLGAGAAAARAPATPGAAACARPRRRAAPATAARCSPRAPARPCVPTPSRAAAAASRRWYSSTSGRSSFSRASISRFFSSRKSVMCPRTVHRRINSSILARQHAALTVCDVFRWRSAPAAFHERLEALQRRVGLALGQAADERAAGDRAQRAERAAELVAVVEMRAAVGRWR